MLKTRFFATTITVVGLSTALAQRSINPTDAGGTVGLPSQSAIEITAPMSPLRPAETDAGFAAIDSMAQPSGPLADPNIIGMPSLDEDGVAILDTGEEASLNLWRIRPIVSTGVVYDDNIFISNSDRRGDVIFNIGGGLAFELGDYRTLENNYLLLEYIATGYFFSKYTEQNAFNQSAALLGQYRFNQLAVQLESTYQYLTGAERQIGGFADRNLIFNDLRFIYDWSEKTTFDLELSQDSYIYDNEYNSAYYFQAMAGMDYLVFPKVRLGLEGGAGFVEADNNPGQTFQIINARAKYDLTGKVAIKATGGVQFNQYDGARDAQAFPIFSLGAEYLPFPNTAISLVGYRNLLVSPSLNNQDYWATGIELGITQTIAQRFQLGLNGGYENDEYVSNRRGVRATRVDNYFYIQPNVSYNFLKYLTASVFYLHRLNDSTKTVDTWYDNQVGFELSAAF